MQSLYAEKSVANLDEEGATLPPPLTPHATSQAVGAWRCSVSCISAHWNMSGLSARELALARMCCVTWLDTMNSVIRTDKELPVRQGETYAMKKRLFLNTALVALLGVGLYALTQPAPIAHAAPPTSHTITRISGSAAIAAFEYSQGDVTDFVNVIAATKGFQLSQLVSGPGVRVDVTECTQVGENVECVSFAGIEPVPGFQIPNKLTSAALPEMVVPVSPTDEFGEPSGPPAFDVSLAISWTGVGEITTQSQVSHIRIGHIFSEMLRFKGASRDATVSGTLSYPSPYFGPIALTGDDTVYAALVSNGSMDVIIQR